MQCAPTWITANQRLVSHIQKTYNQTQHHAGKKVWETPDCLSLKHWILRAYDTLPESTAYILTPSQERILWENIIAQTLETLPAEWALLSTRSLAKTAQSAWRLLQESYTPLALLAGTDSPETHVFCKWADTFTQALHQKNAIDLHTCTQRVIEAIARQDIPLPKKIILVGFEEISQQTRALFELLDTQCELEYQQNATSLSENPYTIGLPSEEIEFRTMATWAYQMQQAHPDQFIGCVVPDLHTKRHTLIRIFNEIFADIPYNLSGGLPFFHFPLIQSAFDILQLGTSTLDIPSLSRLLTSPFLGGAEQEWTARATLDIQLRKMQEPCVYAKHLEAIMLHQGNCNIWLSQYIQYKVQYPARSTQHTAYAWRPYFATLLQCMGWPGERTLSSTEYQLVQRWNALLEEFTQLDAVLEKRLSYKEALFQLKQLAIETVFQPHTMTTSVQVLGLLEAVGLPFAGLWVSGMTQESWPKEATPNPFIPLALQRTRNMPHASSERELAYSKTLTQHFSQSAPQVIFSYPLQKEDRAHAASQLIQHFAEIEIPPTLPRAYTPLLHDALEYLEDDTAPALPLSSLSLDTPLPGGSSIFTHQAACPFRAFARLRLNAICMPTPAPALTPQERGICLHGILEQIWRLLEDHATLCLHDNQALENLLKPLVQNALQQLAQKRPFSLQPHFLALEEKRLIAQISTWLALEKKRPPFHVVGIESEKILFFAGLPLKLRVDREDVLEDGSHMIIDYKTGKGSPTDWVGSRLHSPQLPLYAVTANAPIQTLTFAQITAEKLGFSGVGEKESGILGVDTAQKRFHQSLEAFFMEAEKNLMQLAQDFQQGDARVDPKELEQTCRQCDLQALCRIYQKYPS